jgi:hypothetical protein
MELFLPPSIHILTTIERPSAEGFSTAMVQNPSAEGFG